MEKSRCACKSYKEPSDGKCRVLDGNDKNEKTHQVHYDSMRTKREKLHIALPMSVYDGENKWDEYRG